MDPSAPQWTTYLTALMTPVVALLGAGIAYRQWRTARDKLRLDLFDRRLAVHAAVLRFLGDYSASGIVTPELERTYLVGISGCQWLFGPEVRHYLEETFWQKVVDLGCGRGLLEGLEPGDERTRLVMQQADLRKWFMDQYKVLDELFMPYLGFHEATGR